MRTLAIRLPTLAIVCLLCTLGGDPCISGDKDDDELTGTWVMERIVQGGPDSSFEETHPLPNPTTLSYHKGWYLSESPRRGKEYFKYRCDHNKRPHEFDVWRVENEEATRQDISREPDLWGIYEIREGRLWRCYGLARETFITKPGRPAGDRRLTGERPKSFEVLGRDGCVLTVHGRRGKVADHK
jgi:hypothetical protein